MRSRGQSPLLPYTNTQRLPLKQRSRGASTLTRVALLSTAVICLVYGTYSAVAYLGDGSTDGSSDAAGGTGRGLAAHEEVAQLQGKNMPILEGQEENTQLQTQGQAQEKPPDLNSEGLSADHAARATDSVEQLHDGALSTELSGLYTMTAIDIEGQSVDLSDFAGEVSLVVNVASECGYTDSNYRGLQQLYEQYKASGFEVLAFPCDSFHQESGTDQAVKDFARARYGVTFPLFQKVEALGQDAHPVFKFLTQNSPGGSLVSWNFNKWLINRQGMPVKRYDSAFDRQQLEEDIAAELLKSA